MLPTDAKARKAIPIYSGFIKYFPHGIAAVAELSRIGNDQHNPGQPLHWAKEKSQDELDALMRHTVDFAIDASFRDPDGVHPAVKRAWRAMADLERLHDSGVNIFAVEVAEDEEDGSQMDVPHALTVEELIDLARSEPACDSPSDRACDAFANRLWGCDFGEVDATVYVTLYHDGDHTYVEGPYNSQHEAETSARLNKNSRPGVRAIVANH